MGEFEDALGSLLSSPKDMEKILGLARELSGTLGGDTEDPPQPKSEPKKESAGLFGALGDIDPKIFGIISRLMGEYSSASSDKTALMTSIKPYIREERREALDKAVKVAKIAHIAKIAFSEFSGGDLNIDI